MHDPVLDKYSQDGWIFCLKIPLPSLSHSRRATVHVRVNDVNEFSPVFVERRYEASVPEGRLFDRIVRVEALDADCSPQYSQICFYDIITPNVPFAIDNDGETIAWWPAGDVLPFSSYSLNSKNL